LMIRPPPPSPLFPYTTLFRSAVALGAVQHDLAQLWRIRSGSDQRPLAAVNLHAIAAAGKRDRADMRRRDRAVLKPAADEHVVGRDRKSTRLNSSHDQISYAVF